MKTKQERARYHGGLKGHVLRVPSPYFWPRTKKGITDLWKTRYCALDRFVKLPSRAKQERVLFVIVVDSVLRSTIAGDADLYFDHMSRLIERRENPRNNLTAEEAGLTHQPTHERFAVFCGWPRTSAFFD